MDDEVSTYLGQKGYTIYKESICVKEQQYIREELTVRPYVPKSPVQPRPFPIYQESQKKFYLPRFFAINTYGAPDEIRISSGDEINIEFKGNLRDDQQVIVDKYINHVNKEKDTAAEGGLLEIPCGKGKTVLSLKIISLLKKKTLVIVHKGFLLNQWKERIEQFLPTARIGVIQGQIIDMEDKDIVIGMLQSLSMKKYPQDMFSSFGLTIVDECHHISSEVFSKSLKAIVTKYTLGLSATMDRKDGLTKVFKMYLGDIIYKEDREPDEGVLVKGIQYCVDDEEYNETIYDYRGNPAYSGMICKVCGYEKRSEFIISVLEKERRDYNNQQIMILAQQKNILVYLHNAISERNIATVGYYVGGMKEQDLKQSENCEVILATYAMAAEGLDIKTLTTMILATPRTDVTQAVGRILRVKHERPLVVDIIDSHQVFKKQWDKRLKFYTKSGYKVLVSNNNLYENNEWDMVSNNGKKIKNKKTAIKDSNNELPKGVCLVKV